MLPDLDVLHDRIEILFGASLPCEFTFWRGRIFLSGIISEHERLDENSPVLHAVLSTPLRHAALAYEPDSQRLILWKELLCPWQEERIAKFIRAFLAEFDEAMNVACEWFMAERRR